MDLVLDFGRLWRWAFGAKDYSPEIRNALQRWLEAIKPQHRKRAMLNETNATRQADKRARVSAIREAVRLKEGRLFKKGRAANGIRTLAIRGVAKSRRESFNTVRKLYQRHGTGPDRHAD